MTKYILIVGDWVVDEYWYLVRHHSDTSSHTGFDHYRILSQPTDIVRDLCASGHVARTLYKLAGTEEKRPYCIWGIGKWNDADTQFIKHLIHARTTTPWCSASTANFYLTPNDKFCNTDTTEINLATVDSGAETIRVVRTYHKEIGRFEQINRVDWELKRQDNKVFSLPENMPAPDQVAAIVIYDLNKGVITPQLIDEISERYTAAPWFIRSKKSNPTWLPKVKGQIKLLVISPEVAVLENAWERWLINGRIGWQGLQTVSSSSAENTILLSDYGELIGKLSSPDKSNEQCVVGKSATNIRPSSIFSLGWSSAFFAASIYHSVIDQNGTGFQQEDIEKSLDYADQNPVLLESEKTKDQENKVREEKSKTRSWVTRSSWGAEKDDWEQALRNHGVIKSKSPDDPDTLEVWRACSQIPGYVACIEEKKRIIDEIGKSIRTFSRRGENKKSLSILLQADPGSGKTFLAKSLAKSFGFAFLSFDITQMVHRDELLDLFDMVATKQAEEKGKILIFVDEINAKVDGQQVYGAFLSPLEEGVFLRRGNRFTLRPCIWVFAGTNFEDDKLPHGDKLSDYKTRMSMIKQIDYQSLRQMSRDKFRVEQQARLEQVYLGATMIRNRYSDIELVSYDVLDKFYQEEPASAPARLISRKAESLRNVQYGRVTSDNCEPGLWGETWSTDEKKHMVRIVFE